MMRAARKLVTFVALLYRAYYRTLRVRALLPDGTLLSPLDYPFGPEIFAMCERDALALGGLLGGARFTVLVAQGRDGDLATCAAERLGALVVRGSSRRGGTRALKALVEGLRASSHPAALVVDGPLGPSGEAKEGAVLCGRKTGRPVRAIGAAARWKLVFAGAWSRIFLPLPFSRVLIVCEEALPFPPAGGKVDDAALAAELTRRLARARERALAEVGKVSR